MPRYKVILECSGPVGDAALTYRMTASSPQAAEFRACHDTCPRFAEWRTQHKAELIYTNAQHAAERINRNDFNKEGWMGGRKR